jgi:hypothetical protein
MSVKKQNVGSGGARGRRGGPERRYVTLGKTATRVVKGEEDLSTWTDVELERGRKRDRNGGWTGRPPLVVPRGIHEELVRRRMREADRVLLEEGTLAAVRLWVDVVNDEEADLSMRLRASENIIDRVRGKAAQPIYVATPADAPETPWEQMVKRAVVGTLEQARELLASNDDDVVEGEVVDG